MGAGSFTAGRRNGKRTRRQFHSEAEGIVYFVSEQLASCCHRHRKLTGLCTGAPQGAGGRGAALGSNSLLAEPEAQCQRGIQVARSMAASICCDQQKRLEAHF